MINSTKVLLRLQRCSEQFSQLTGEKRRQENTANEKDRELEDTRRHLVDKEADVAKLQNMQHAYVDELVRSAHICCVKFTVCYVLEMFATG